MPQSIHSTLDRKSRAEPQNEVNLFVDGGRGLSIRVAFACTGPPWYSSSTMRRSNSIAGREKRGNGGRATASLRVVTLRVCIAFAAAGSSTACSDGSDSSASTSKGDSATSSAQAPGTSGSASGTTSTTSARQGQTASSSSSMSNATNATSTGGGMNANGSASGGASGAGNTESVESSAGGAPDDTGTTSGSVTSTSSGGTGSEQTPSPGCGVVPADLSSRNENEDVGGVPRSYFLSIPDGYDANVPYPVVFAFHGSGDSGEGFSGWAGVEEAAAGQAIFVYFDGIDGVWEPEVFDSDFDFADQVFDYLKTTYCVDENAVFAFGFSYGGWASTQFACARSDLLRGVASVAGGGPMGQCNTPMAMMLVHGSADEAEPISSSLSTRQHFLDNNGCSEDDPSPVADPCVAYQGCREPLVWCEHPGGHSIPSFAPEAIWDFFDSLR